jgi:hypothetical protein
MIRLINYGYKNHKVGDIVDLGKKKNESMISIGRAVAVTNKTPKKSEDKIEKPIFTEQPKKIKKSEGSKNKKNYGGRTSNNNRPNKQKD